MLLVGAKTENTVEEEKDDCLLTHYNQEQGEVK